MLFRSAIVVREASGVVADDDLSHAVAAFIGEAIAGHVTVTQADDADAALDALPGADLRQKEVIQGIAATLDAAHLLLVEVHRSAEAVEIAATFHDGLTGRQLSELSAVAPPGALLETVDLLAQRCLKSEPIASLPRRQVIAGPLHLAAERHFLLAVEHYLAQSTQQAILQCLKAIEMHPQHERARLLLAEIYLAADERTLARATLHRALQLLTTLRQPARAATLLRLVDPQLLQAAEMQKLTLALPADWPAGEDVLYDLSWHKQLVLQGRGRAQAGTIEIQMPSARLPLILDLRLTCGNSQIGRAHV